MISFKCPGGVYNAVPPRVIFERGSSSSAREEVAFLGCKRALVLSTPGRSEMAQTVVDRIGDLCAGFLPEAISQVPIELAVSVREKAKAMAADCLVAVGGGAAIGLAKGIAYEYGAPIINIPTTYSGSEVTGFCGITIDGVKRMHISTRMLAHTVVYDPELTVGLPVQVSAASAMNALAHCVDVVYTPTVNPYIALAAAEGANTVSKAVLDVVKDPHDRDARERLLFGSYLSGVALSGGFALQHGIAHVLGGTFGIDHGMSHSLTLPYVAAYNSRFARASLEPLARAMGGGVGDIGGAIYDIRTKIGLPAGLKEIGFDENELVRLAEITVETDNGANPAPVTMESVMEIVSEMWEGRRPEEQAR